MKKIFLSLIAGLLFVAETQAVPPSWTQDAVRQRDFPASEWYIGFVRDRLKAGENVDARLRNLERDAQNQLAQSIIVTIEGGDEVINTSDQIQIDGNHTEVITTNYRQAITTATRATTVKTEVKSYHDPSTGRLYAFAAVKRNDLAAYYKRQISVDLNKVETAVSVSEELVNVGKKMSAQRKIEDAEEILMDVVYQRDLLIAVEADVSDEDLQTERLNDLQRTIAQLLIWLKQSTFVYVDCSYEFKGKKHDAFSYDPGILCDIITQVLSENNCSVTENKDEADYVLTIITSTTQRSDGSGQFGIISYYANARGTLHNRLTNRTTVNFSILNDADCYSAGRNAEDAATKAFKLPALRNKILEKILPRIKD
jgi:hypothetical protein